MTLQKTRSSPDPRQPSEPPEPIGVVALAVALAACALWLDGPASAVQAFLAVLAVFVGLRRP